jgi:hypothetical protein
MKKATVALLVVLLLASFGLFAGNHGGQPDPTTLSECLQLNACIPSVSWMWIGDCSDGESSVADIFSFGHGQCCTQVSVNGYGDQEIGKCLYALSNNRTGYVINMKARALKSSLSGYQDAFINFTASCGGAEVTTADDTWMEATACVEEFSELTSLQMTSNEIGLSVDAADYMMAVSGQYKGLVYFDFIAN